MHLTITVDLALNTSPQAHTWHAAPGPDVLVTMESCGSIGRGTGIAMILRTQSRSWVSMSVLSGPSISYLCVPPAAIPDIYSEMVYFPVQLYSVDQFRDPVDEILAVSRKSCFLDRSAPL